MKGSWQAPGSYSFAKLFECDQVRSERLAVGELCGPVAPFRIKKIKQAGCAAPVGILAYVARLLRLVQIPGAIKSHQLVVGVQVLKGVPHVRQYLAVRESFLFLRLRDGIGGAGNLALVAIE